MASYKGVIPDQPGFPNRDATKPIDPRQAAMSDNRLRDLDLLKRKRNGFKGDSRGKAVYLLCYLLRRGTHLSYVEILSRAIELGAECTPPLPEKTCKRNLEDSLKMEKVSNATIVKWFQMTPEEKELFFPIATKRKKAIGRKALTEYRRSLVLGFVRRDSVVPSYGEVREYLSVLDINASRSTIFADYVALEIKNPRSNR